MKPSRKQDHGICPKGARTVGKAQYQHPDLVPVGTTFRNYFDLVEKNVEVHKVKPRPYFLYEGKKFDRARQDYVVIIWRKRRNS